MDFRSSKSVRVTHNLHDSLLAKLMTGYVGEDKTSEMYRKWKLQFKRYRDSSAEENYSIQDDFNFLEKSGLLRVGQYDVLEDIFNHVDTKALFDIKLASQMIDNISLAQIQNKDENACIAEIRVNFWNGCPAVEKHLTDMIGDFVSKMEYALYPQSASTVDEFYLVSLTCPTKIALGIINGTENAKKYENLANLISEFIETLRAFISCHSKHAKNSSIYIAKQLLNMLEDMKKKFKVKRWKFDWSDCIIIFVEFYSQFDFKIALNGSSFTKSIETTLHCIIRNFNDVQLKVPHIEIRGDFESRRTFSAAYSKGANGVPFDLKKISKPERIPTEKELVSVSKHIGAKFQLLGVYLGLTSTQLEQIRMTHGFDIQTQIFRILVSWRNENGSEATIRNLLHAVNETCCTVDVVRIAKILNREYLNNSPIVDGKRCC